MDLDWRDIAIAEKVRSFQGLKGQTVPVSILGIFGRGEQMPVIVEDVGRIGGKYYLVFRESAGADLAQIPLEEVEL